MQSIFRDFRRILAFTSCSLRLQFKRLLDSRYLALLLVSQIQDGGYKHANEIRPTKNAGTAG